MSTVTPTTACRDSSHVSPCAGQPPPPPPLYTTISTGPLLASSTVPGFSPQTSAAIESFGAAVGSPETQAALQSTAEGPQVQGAILAPAAEGAPTVSPDFYVNRPAPPPLQQVLNYTQVVALRGGAATMWCSRRPIVARRGWPSEVTRGLCH